MKCVSRQNAISKIEYEYILYAKRCTCHQGPKTYLALAFRERGKRGGTLIND